MEISRTVKNRTIKMVTMMTRTVKLTRVTVTTTTVDVVAATTVITMVVGRGGGGRGNDNRQGQGNGGSQNQLPGPAYIGSEVWNAVSRDERMCIIRAREQAHGQSAHNANQSHRDGGSTIQGPPMTIHLNKQTQQCSNQQAQQQPGNLLCQMMSQSSAHASQAGTQRRGDDNAITMNGMIYCQTVNNMNFKCCISQQSCNSVAGALIDGGANGGMFGADVRILKFVENAHIDVTGFADVEVHWSSYCSRCSCCQEHSRWTCDPYHVSVCRPWIWKDCPLQGTDGALWCLG